LAFDLGWGRQNETFNTWSYRLDEINAGLSGGIGFEWAGTRLDFLAQAALAVYLLEYGNGDSRTPLGSWFGLAVQYTLPMPLSNPWVILQLRVSGGLRLAEGISLQDESLHSGFEPNFELGLSFPL
jgi:hypothetical protein